MRPPIVHSQPDFERWLITETAVYARLHHQAASKEDERSHLLREQVKWQFTFYLTTLGVYTDRFPEDLEPVAHDRAALMDVIRNGRSLIATTEAQVEAARKKERESS